MASEDQFQESLAFLQKTNADGESVYDQLAKVVGKAGKLYLCYQVASFLFSHDYSAPPDSALVLGRLSKPFTASRRNRTDATGKVLCKSLVSA